MTKFIFILLLLLPCLMYCQTNDCVFPENEEQEIKSFAISLVKEHVNAMNAYLPEYELSNEERIEVIENVKHYYTDNFTHSDKNFTNADKSLLLNELYDRLGKKFPKGINIEILEDSFKTGNVYLSNSNQFCIEVNFYINIEQKIYPQKAIIYYYPNFKNDNFLKAKIFSISINSKGILPKTCIRRVTAEKSIYVKAKKIALEFENLLNKTVDINNINSTEEMIIKYAPYLTSASNTITIREDIYPNQNIDPENNSFLNDYLINLKKVYKPSSAKSINFSNYTYSEETLCSDQTEKYSCLLLSYQSEFNASDNNFPPRMRVIKFKIQNDSLIVVNIDFLEALSNTEQAELKYKENESLTKIINENNENTSLTPQNAAKSVLQNFEKLANRQVTDNYLTEKNFNEKINEIFSTASRIENDIDPKSGPNDDMSNTKDPLAYFNDLRISFNPFNKEEKSILFEPFKEGEIYNITQISDTLALIDIFYNSVFKGYINNSTKTEYPEKKRLITVIWEGSTPKIYLVKFYNPEIDGEENRDYDKDGIINKIDRCPKEPGKKETGGCPDIDFDGIPDREDDCPDTPGYFGSRGCPDQDKDGIADKDDLCKDKKGFKETSGCPDQDRDGVMDSKDRCLNVYGKPELNGCPDWDGDNIPDIDDYCIYVIGLKRFNGCPDSDNDDVPDNNDNCPNEKGKISLNGCPDDDNDMVINSLDKCPNEFGLESLQGCPDLDKDGIADIFDECPTEYGRFIHNGCPDYDGDGFSKNDDKCPCVEGVVGINGCPTYLKRVHIGVNFDFFKGETFNYNFFSNRIQQNIENQEISRLGLSFYAPIGLFFSNFVKTKNKIPVISYTIEEISRADRMLTAQGINTNPIAYNSSRSNVTMFDAGVYVAPWYKSHYMKSLHFKLGMSFVFGQVWDQYSGTLQNLSYIPGSFYYAVEKKIVNNNNFITGVALVFPFFQFETEYNFLLKNFSVKGGLNIPFNVFMTGIDKESERGRTRQINKKYFIRRIRLGLNYTALSGNMSYYKNLKGNNYWNALKDDFSKPNFNKFGISFYAPVGFFFSGFNQAFDKKPELYYSKQEIDLNVNILSQQNIAHTVPVRTNSRSAVTAYNIGFYFAPFKSLPKLTETPKLFIRNIHFLLGTSIIRGSAWDEYTGDITIKLPMSNPSNSTYAVDKKDVSNDNFIIGAALVFPFIQFEIGYNNLYKQTFINLGTNIPFGFKSPTPQKQYICY